MKKFKARHNHFEDVFFGGMGGGGVIIYVYMYLILHIRHVNA